MTHLNEVSDTEDDMLDSTMTDREEGSRLSCQIELTEKLNGMQITLPDNQM